MSRVRETCDAELGDSGGGSACPTITTRCGQPRRAVLVLADGARIGLCWQCAMVFSGKSMPAGSWLLDARRKSDKCARCGLARGFHGPVLAAAGDPKCEGFAEVKA